MRKIFSKWIDRYFSDEEAVLLFVLLGGALLIILTLGQMLTPVFAGLILAFLMQGAVSWLESRKLSHILSVSLVFVLFVSVTLALLLFVLPLVWRQAGNLFNELPRILSEVQQLALLLPKQYPDMISVAQVNELINSAAAELSQVGQWVVTFSLNSIGSVVVIPSV